jgi:DNA-binding NarL/FixJ family response regulator
VTSIEGAYGSVGVVDFSATTVAPYRVVVIDNIVFERRLLRAWLESSGHFLVVGEASDTEAGVPLAAALEPQLVVLDLSTAGGDGVEALTRLTALSPRPVVVVYSGLLSADLGGAPRRLGAAACFDKNVGLASLTDELVQVVEASLERPLGRWTGSPTGRVPEKRGGYLSPLLLSVSQLHHPADDSPTAPPLAPLRTATVSGWL